MLSLVTRWHHYRLHVVRVAYKSHLLGIEWLLLAHLARLNGNALWLHVNRAAPALVAHGVVGLTLAPLRRLLLREAHVLRLHHVRGHAQSLLVVRRPGYRAHLRLLHHHIERFLRWHGVVHLVTDGLLPTEVDVVVVEGVEHLAEGLVQPGVRLVHAGTLRVMRDRLTAHLLVELLHGVLVAHVHHVDDLVAAHVVHLSCNLPFLNLWLCLLRI